MTKKKGSVSAPPSVDAAGPTEADLSAYVRHLGWSLDDRERYAHEIRTQYALVLGRTRADGDVLGMRFGHVVDVEGGVAPLLPGTKLAVADLRGLVRGRDRIPNHLGLFWAGELLEAGAGALLESVGQLAKMTDTASLERNVLSSISEILSREVRRQLLLRTLQGQRWNLTHTANVLRMNGPSAVIRSIKELGLESEYQKARSPGGMMRQGRPVAKKTSDSEANNKKHSRH